MAATSYNIEHVRGDTYFSPSWMFTNNEVPQNITMQELLDGINDGTYDPIELSEYEITSNVRSSPVGKIIIDISQYIKTSGNFMSFIIPHTVSEKLANERTALGYDIQFKHKTTGYVKTIIAGSYTITTDYTHNDVI